ncbi:thiamine phosphate synthase [Pedobacter petrophilus]|uniref:Thiamine phosphate synthase n=1 Tax=Pedobacter petrophilus TaxID=1908241 RepID=A0A7K0FVW0_9SPHI|nr:thiamine phosphate synthase [Pedobacter petrophilus]MRX75688.1 thiamine phosphate synthase [Pedobacter petrophilus]
MELIVISDPGIIANEASVINLLFEAGMTRFHLRKPNWSSNQCHDLLKEINPVFHPDIALHQHHILADNINTKRLHYTEKHRLACNQEEINSQKQEGFFCSTPVHRLADLPFLNAFNCVFFSPVFNSISKPGYESELKKGFVLEKASPSTSVIALGGIEARNIEQISQMKFDGAAVLGAIWKNPEQAVNIFRQLNTLIMNHK